VDVVREAGEWRELGNGAWGRGGGVLGFVHVDVMQHVQDDLNLRMKAEIGVVELSRIFFLF